MIEFIQQNPVAVIVLGLAVILVILTLIVTLE